MRIHFFCHDSSQGVSETERALRPRVAFMTVQYDCVQTGPGTFVNYVESRIEDLDLTIFSQDISASDERHRRVDFSSLKGWPGGQFIRSYAYHRAVSRAHAAHPFDLVWYNTSPKTGFFSALLNSDVPIVLMVNDYNNAISRYPFESRRELGTGQSVMRPIWRVFEKWALRACDAVVVNSRFMKRAMGMWYGLPEEKLFLLYKAVDTDFFSFKPDRPFESPLQVLFVKRDYVRGGLEDLIAALCRLSVQTELTVAGPDYRRASAIRAMVQTYGYEGDVNFLGRVDRNRMRDLVQTHDLFCVPSRAEALGVVFLEALASGLPAVGTRVGGIPEVLDDGQAGWLAPPQDAEGLRRTLEAVIRDPEARQQRVRRGRAHVAQFTVDRMIRRMEAITRQVRSQRSLATT